MFGRSLLRRIGAYVVPVWDYALMTEPLSDGQLAALGWNGPRGAGDMSNQFHYFRMTRDNRMLWGGYDAVYYNGGRIRDEHANSPATFGKLAEHFFTAFPQLEGLSFTHAWGGSSTPAAGSARSSAAPTAAAWPTRRGTPASGSVRPGSGAGDAGQDRKP